MKRKLLTNYLLSGALAISITGCVSSPVDDLTDFMRKTKQDAIGSEPPRPKSDISQSEYVAFKYSATKLRSPFEPPAQFVQRNTNEKIEKTVAPPDLERVKEDLERFQIGELKMVGTMSNTDNIYALIRDSESQVHQISVGAYMGENHGRVVAINELTVEFVELVLENSVRWIQRVGVLKLEEGKR